MYSGRRDQEKKAELQASKITIAINTGRFPRCVALKPPSSLLIARVVRRLSKINRYC
jgi:hypothetical protein